MRHAKAQVASLDVIISIVAVLCFIALVFLLFPVKKENSQIWGGKVFASIENLNDRMPATAFMSRYSIDDSKLSAFRLLSSDDAERLILAGSEYSDITSDVCIYFANSNGILQIDGDDAIGRVYQDQAHSLPKILCPISNPCRHYSKTTSYARPVERQNRIVNMHVVVCS